MFWVLLSKNLFFSPHYFKKRLFSICHRAPNKTVHTGIILMSDADDSWTKLHMIQIFPSEKDCSQPLSLLERAWNQWGEVIIYIWQSVSTNNRRSLCHKLLIADQRETKGMYSVKSIFLAGTFNIEMLAVLCLISVLKRFFGYIIFLCWSFF